MADIVEDKDLHRITLTAIIYSKSGKYLIVKRPSNIKVFPGLWTVPGGGLEVRDYINTKKTTKDAWYRVLEQTLKREIREETSLEISKIEYLTDLVFIRPDNIPVLVLSYYARSSSEKVKLNDENVDYKWVSVQDLKEFDLIEGIHEEIVEVDKLLKQK